jgi:hypothetical protein
MKNQLPPSLQRFSVAFDTAVRAEITPTLAHADRPEPRRAGRRRPRVLAGSTLGLAGVGAALVLALGGSAAPPAFAITKSGDGSLTVKITTTTWLPGANRKLAALGTHEQILIQMASGPARVSGPVNCVPDPPGATVPGPPVKVYVGTNNTEVIPGSGTGAGTLHVADCYRYNSRRYSLAGNSGTIGVSEQ